MKSKIKYIIIILIVALLLGGAVAALVLTKPAAEEEETETSASETTSQLLYDKNPHDIDTLTITNETSSYKVERVGEGDAAMWGVFEYLMAPLNGTVIEKLVQSAATITAQQVVVESAEDLSIYGLDKPLAEFKAEFSDSQNTVKDVLIGNPTPKNTLYYMCFKGESKVYTVFKTDIDCFLNDKTDCVSRTLYTAYTTTDTNDTTDYTRINKISIDRADLDYDIVIEYDTRLDNPDTIVSNSSSFRMTSPVTLDLNPDKCVDVTQGVFGLTADSFEVIAPTAEQLTEYGFDAPNGTITMNIVGGDFNMTVGGDYFDDSGNGYYVFVDGINVIYKMSAASLPWMTFKPLDITTSMITSNYIYGVSSLDMVCGGDEAHFTMTGSSDDDFAVKLDGTDVDKGDFKTLYQFILKAPAEQLCFDETTGEPQAKITINSDTGNDTIEFYKSADRRSIIKLNGKSSFSCKTAYVDRLVENLQRYKNGETLIVTW